MSGTCFPSLKGLRARLTVDGEEGLWDLGSQSTEQKAEADGTFACHPPACGEPASEWENGSPVKALLTWHRPQRLRPAEDSLGEGTVGRG